MKFCVARDLSLQYLHHPHLGGAQQVDRECRVVDAKTAVVQNQIQIEPRPFDLVRNQRLTRRIRSGESNWLGQRPTRDVAHRVRRPSQTAGRRVFPRDHTVRAQRRGRFRSSPTIHRGDECGYRIVDGWCQIKFLQQFRRCDVTVVTHRVAGDRKCMVVCIAAISLHVAIRTLIGEIEFSGQRIIHGGR